MIKRKGIFFLALFFCQSLWAQKGNKDELNFVKGLGWQAIQQKAQREGKYIFLDLMATWCVPCKKMEKEVYTNAALVGFMNKNYVSLKLQMDTTDSDSRETKRWHGFADSIGRKFNVDGFPTFLFFTPSGNMIFRDAGYKDAKTFLTISTQAMDPGNATLFSRLENYKKGVKQQDNLYELARYAKTLNDHLVAREIAGDYILKTPRAELLSPEKILFVSDLARNKKLADSLAKVYKTTHLDKLSAQELCTGKYFSFIRRFISLINSQDTFFYLSYNKPDVVNRLTEFRDLADIIVHRTITREELDDKLSTQHSDLDTINFNQLYYTIYTKYPKTNADLLILDYQIKLYKTAKNWPVYTKTLIDRVERYGPFGYPGDFNDYNWNNHAWELFTYSSNPTELQKALTWSDSAISIAGTKKDSVSGYNWLDTKANLLYKLGKVHEAIAIQESVVQKSPGSKDFKENLEKMKKRVPTWTPLH